MLLQVDVWVTAEVASDELGDWLAGDETDRLIAMAANQWFEGIFDALEGRLNIFTEWGTNSEWSIEPLAEDLEVSPLEFIDLETLPQSLIEVAKIFDAFGSKAEHLADRLGGSEDTLAGSAIEGGHRGTGEALGQGNHFDAAPVGEWDVEDTLHAVLLVVDRRAGADQDHLGHTWDAASAGRAVASPRSVPRRAPSVNSPTAVA